MKPFLSKLYKNVRLKTYDYTANGSYFVTNNTHFSLPLITTKVKEIVKRELLDLPKRFAGMSIYYYSVMPTHIHVVLQMINCSVPLTEIWRVFKSKSTVEAKRNGLKEVFLWQRNYFEHIVRNEKALEKIVKYIMGNPFKERLPLNEIYGDRIPKLEI